MSSQVMVCVVSCMKCQCKSYPLFDRDCYFSDNFKLLSRRQRCSGSIHAAQYGGQSSNEGRSVGDDLNDAARRAGQLCL